VLKPLAEILPDWCHPVSGLSVMALLAALPPEDCHPWVANA
jgi:2-amino-4-hydroxy-6-hydroxymethyldihydropteridine diphosphokinase